MAIDGFSEAESQAFRGYDSELARRWFERVEQLSRWVDVEVEGLTNIPAGRALLVGNHAFGFDSLFPIAAIANRLRRRVWVMGEHSWWKVPFVRRVASALGVIDGTQENLKAVLERDELALVLPGGLREAVKPRELRYQLLWGRRYGFVRAALRHQAPLVPLASIGSDEMFDLVGNAYQRGFRWLKTPSIPLPLPAHVLPWPHRVPLRFRIGEPIPCPAGPEAAEDFAVVRRLRRETEGALHELIESELAARCGIDLG